jgi:glutathione S-transferase
MIRVYFLPRSRAQRVLWTCEELGVPYEAVPITRQAKQAPEHLARHPLGRVPVVELADGTYLFESAAICLYLAERDPEGKLLPTPDATARAFVYQWLFFAMTEIEPYIVRASAAHRSGTTDDEALTRVARAAQVISTELERHDWLVESFSVADIVTTRVLWMALNRDLLPAELAALEEYVQRAQKRPAARRAFEVAERAWREAGFPEREA